ncbi:hypothetical protein EWM64_g3513 [Hericium alpestre]|uniref:Nuclear condensin complex subunit 3 C-terminal domain-containing protein n=1 Tax=Hericium alpestre TaxID=135208 RepID=A0A4Z0A3Q9_9AGAM|nr:hypothetical protein EWM64_g3513 [Hericium alpestre]
MEAMATAIPKAFDQAQSSMATHQKNFIALHKIHVEAANLTKEVNGGRKLVGEHAFEDRFIDMVNRVLVVKKGTTVADRSVKFVGGYVKFLNTKAAEEKAKQEEDEEEQEETTASRFTARLLKHLLKGFVAKDKNVRYRVVHFVAEMMASVGEMDEDAYDMLRSSLMERVRDKEPTVRVQAVIALSKLCESETPEDVEKDEQTALQVLEDILAHDPSADVRRAALLNIPASPTTLTALLARTRDVDTTVRKLVYSAILEGNCFIPGSEEAAMGVTHPRVLSIAQRELIVRNGLGDREPAVRAAAGKLVATWVEAVGIAKGSYMENTLAFLQTFDLTESTVAEDALLSVFVTRPDYFDALEFDDTFWTDLNHEKAFLIRVFADHCISQNEEKRLDAVLPVVTALAFGIEKAHDDLQKLLSEVDEQESEDDRDDERIARESVISEMLRLSVNLDYADETGRRKMDSLVRAMLQQESLPDSLVPRCLDVLRVLWTNEKYVIQMVVEIVHELRDPKESEDDDSREEAEVEAETISVIDDEEGARAAPAPVIRSRPVPRRLEDMSPEERARAEAIDLRCLDLCIGMLERINGTFEENSTLEGILGELVVPAVKSKDVQLREKGLISLGLCCLIARRMALNSFQLFLSQVKSAPEPLKIRVLQVVFDILMVHAHDFFSKDTRNGAFVINILLEILSEEGSEEEKVEALIAIGFAKLMLSGVVTDERVLPALVLVYLSPDTVDNQELRQCLSYFFPVYCYSSPTNQRRMQSIFLSIFEQLSHEYRELEDEQDMVSPAQVSGMFVDWTDPQKIIELPNLTPDPDVHVDMAADVVKALFNQDMEKDDKKVLCQMLGKLYLPAEIDDDKVRKIKLLVQTLLARRPLRDTTATNALNKFDAAISKKYEKQLEAFNEEEFRELESLKDLFAFLDDIIPEGSDEEVEPPKKRAGRKRRSESVATDATTTTAAEEEPVTPSRRKGKRQSKKRRVSQSDSDEVDDAQVSPAASTSIAPTRTMPRRAATKKVDMTPIAISSDDDEEEEEDEDEESTPVPRKLGRPSKKAAEEEQLDEDIDGLLDGEAPQDSIMDSEEDEDAEVDGMLDE